MVLPSMKIRSIRMWSWKYSMCRIRFAAQPTCTCGVGARCEAAAARRIGTTAARIRIHPR